MRHVRLFVAVLILLVSTGCTEPRDSQPDVSDMPDTNGSEAGDVEQTPGDAYVQLFHGAPDPAVGEFDIYARSRGEAILLADDLQFHHHTNFLTIPAADDLELVVAQPAASNDGTLEEGEVQVTTSASGLAEGSYNVAVIHGVLTPEDFERERPLAVSIRSNLQTEPPQMQDFAVQFFHASPDTPAVDLTRANDPETNVADNLAYGQFSDDYTQISGGPVVDLVTENGLFVTNLLFPGSASAAFGDNVFTAVIRGFSTVENEVPDAAPLRVAAVPSNLRQIGVTSASELPVSNGVEAPSFTAAARVKFVHAVSASGYDPADFDIFNGAVTASDVPFGQSTDFVSLPAGRRITVEVSADNQSASPSVTFSRPSSGLPTTRTVFVQGDGASKTIDITVINSQEYRRLQDPYAEGNEVAFNLYNATSDPTLSPVELTVLDTSGQTLVGPVDLSSGASTEIKRFSAEILRRIRFDNGESIFEFGIPAFPINSFITFYLVDAENAPGVRIFAAGEVGSVTELSLIDD